MSWSVDMRCLYCDGKLPLYRKITHGQFCSTAHRKAYWLEQEQLAVERLHQTHNSLRAYRPQVQPELILGPTEPTELGRFVPEVLVPFRSQVAQMVIADAPDFVIDCRPEGPVLNVPAFVSRNIDAAGLAALSGAIAVQNHPLRPCVVELGRRDVTISPWCPSPTFAGSLVVPVAKRVDLIYTCHSAAADMAPRIATLSPLPSRMARPTLNWPLAPLSHTDPQSGPDVAVEEEVPFSNRLLSLAKVQMRGIRIASPIGMEACQDTIPSALLLRRDFALLEFNVPFSGLMLALPLVHSREIGVGSPVGIGAALDVMPAVLLARRDFALAEYEAPFSSPMLVLPRVHSPEIRVASPVGAGVVNVVPSATLVQSDLAADLGKDPVRLLQGTGLLALAMRPVPLVQGTLVVERRAENLGGSQKGTPSEASRNAMSTPPLLPQLKVAEGRRYAVEFRGSQMRPPLPELSDRMASPGDIVLPQRVAPQSAQTAPAGTVREDYVPELAGPVAFEFRAEVPAAEPASAVVSPLAGIPQPLGTKPVRPSSNLTPINRKPFTDAFRPEAPPPPPVMPGFSGMGMPLQEQTPAAKMALWAHAAGFWRDAPRDLKLLMFAIPALLALFFHPALPKVAVAASPATGDLKRSISTVVSGKLANVRQVVNDRAAVALDEDFRSGLDDWASRGDATTRWSFDATGFVRPGPLALYRPSMNLTDYEMQFLGMIDKKAMSWVVRAADFNNYYVLKLTVLKPGPLPTIGLTRYAVVDGKPQDRVDTAVAIDARTDTLYRILLDVRDDNFTLSVQGQMIDNWSEPRLRRGGIGFFTARDEASRVRWVQVTHQYDMLGRLCAYLAPYEIPTTNGSW
jgi:hypothetical protein